MHEHLVFFICALLILCFGLFSKVSDKYLVTSPMFFTLVGIAISPLGLDWLAVDIDTGLIKILAELTLVIVLFFDASELNRYKVTHSRQHIALRLLTIGLPLTMLIGFVIGYFLFNDLPILAVLLMALILSPTDAALGQAVIKHPKLPDFIKQNVSVESGLNDGIALPPIIVCLALLTANAATQSPKQWITFLFLQLILGPVVGLIIGNWGGKLIEIASLRGWMSSIFQRMAAPALAVLCYAAAELVHGNGFIAAFIGGLFLGTNNVAIRARITEFGEAEGQQLTLFIFLIFGLTIVPLLSGYWDVKALVYALLSLTVIRMLPVWLSLLGSDSQWQEKLLFGWFGPRGIASVLYLLLVIGTIGIDGYQYMLSVIVLTVLMSIVLHGISAIPLVNWYNKNGPKHNND